MRFAVLGKDKGKRTGKEREKNGLRYAVCGMRFEVLGKDKGKRTVCGMRYEEGIGGQGRFWVWGKITYKGGGVGGGEFSGIEGLAAE